MSTPRCKLCGEPMPEGEQMFNFHGFSGPCPKPPLEKLAEELTPVERAYGLLWREPYPSEKAKAARKELLSVLTKGGQERGISYANDIYGPMTPPEEA